MVVSSAGLRPESDCTGKAQKQLYSKLQTHPLVREGAPYQETRNRQRDKRNLVMGSRWDPDTKTDWPTDWKYSVTASHCSAQKMTPRGWKSIVTFCSPPLFHGQTQNTLILLEAVSGDYRLLAAAVRRAT
jgi:hypothetical protein